MLKANSGEKGVIPILQKRRLRLRELRLFFQAFLQQSSLFWKRSPANVKQGKPIQACGMDLVSSLGNEGLVLLGTLNRVM